MLFSSRTWFQSAPMHVGMDNQPCTKAPGWALGTLLRPCACSWRNTRSWLDLIYHAHGGIICYLLKPDFMEEWSCIVCSPNSLERLVFPHRFQPKRQKRYHEKSAALVKPCSTYFMGAGEESFPECPGCNGQCTGSRILLPLEDRPSPGFGQCPHLAHAQITNPKDFVK